MSAKKLLFLVFLKLLFFLDLWAQPGIRVQGNAVIDSLGQPVKLKGVNLGGWLVWENWMCGMVDTADVNHAHRFSFSVLEKRFGTQQAKVLRNLWEDHWIQANDLDSIKSIGLNLIRVPFSWRTLQDSAGRWDSLHLDSLNYTRLDWIVEQAKIRGLYVVLVYHVWRNQEFEYGSISNQRVVQIHANEIWKMVAKRYKHQNHVIFNLLNEPTGSYQDTIQAELYHTVRAEAPDRLISIEWTYAKPHWQNVLYQWHLYGGVESANLQETEIGFYGSNQHFKQQGWVHTIRHFIEDNSTPFYAGEMHSNEPSLTWLLNQLHGLKVHWSPWTWKTHTQGGWGFIQTQHPTVNVQTDSFAAIYTKWQGLSLTSANKPFVMSVKLAYTRAANNVNPCSLHVAIQALPRIGCEQNYQDYSLNISNAIGTCKYEWSTGDTVLISRVSHPHLYVKVWVRDSVGCQAQDSLIYQVQTLDSASQQKLVRIDTCANGTLLVGTPKGWQPLFQLQSFNADTPKLSLPNGTLMFRNGSFWQQAQGRWTKVGVSIYDTLPALPSDSGKIIWRNQHLLGWNGTNWLMLDAMRFEERGLTAAYGLQKLVEGYNGWALEVWKKSANQYLKIGFTNNGCLDTVSLLSFIGSDTAFVAVWYDQSMQNRHAYSGYIQQKGLYTAMPIIAMGGKMCRMSNGQLAIQFIRAKANNLNIHLPATNSNELMALFTAQSTSSLKQAIVAGAKDNSLAIYYRNQKLIAENAWRFTLLESAVLPLTPVAGLVIISFNHNKMYSSFQTIQNSNANQISKPFTHIGAQFANGVGYDYLDGLMGGLVIYHSVFNEIEQQWLFDFWKFKNH